MPIAMRYGSNDYTRSGGASGGGGGITMSLLWTNPSPTSSFAAQTVSVDLSGYDAYGVLVLFGTSNPNIVPMQVLPCDSARDGVLSVVARSNNNNGGRLVTFSPTGLTFTACTYNGSSSNAYCIPYKIYGIKGIT